MIERETLRNWLGFERGSIVLVFTDIVGSTKLAVGMGDRDWIPVLKKHFDKARHYKHLHSGYEVKLIGDACMIAFKTTDKALDFAREFSSDTGDPRITLRAAIHLGDVRVVENDIYGVMVNYASRMQHVVKSGIAVSDIAKVRLEHELGENYVRQFTSELLEHEEPLKDFPPDQQTLWKIGPALSLEELAVRMLPQLGPVIRGIVVPIPPEDARRKLTQFSSAKKTGDLKLRIRRRICSGERRGLQNR